MDLSTANCAHDVTSVDGIWPYTAWSTAVQCRDCARNLLVMLLNGAEWVARRVERVQFCDDRAATRRVSMDFYVPAEAPRYRVGNGASVRLIPLTVMRRKTLVNFGVADVDGRALSLMSLRHNQELTRQMILALAEAVLGTAPGEDVETFARAVAYGTQNELSKAYARVPDLDSESDLSRVMRDEGAGRMIRRLADNFVLLVTIDDEGPVRRLVRFSYDEPLALNYKSSRYDATTMTLGRSASVAPRRERLSAWLGWTPTAIRFPTPSAEYTLSYHFEIEAPPGAVISQASLVAGRPVTEDGEKPSWDHVAGGSPVVGLHAVEVPNGSISGVQVLLRPSSRGWLFTNVLASALTSLLLVAMALKSTWKDGQVQVVAGAVFAIGAAFIVFVVQPGEHQMVGRLVAGVRYAMSALIGLLIVAGVGVTLLDRAVHGVLWACAGLAILVCTPVIWAAFWRTHRRRRRVRISPWEQGVDIEETGVSVTADFHNLRDAHEQFGFYRPAIMVQTAEAEHLEGPWTRQIDCRLKARFDTAVRLHRCDACDGAARSPRTVEVPVPR